jgi:hypothetical protein
MKLKEVFHIFAQCRTGHIAHTQERREAYRILMGETQREIALGRYKRKLYINSNMDLRRM